MRIFTTLLLFVSLTTFAQSKTGTIDIDYIITQMPEFITVQASVEEYGKTLDSDLQVKFKQYNDMLEGYKAQEASLTPVQRTEKQKGLFTLESDITKFRDNGLKLIEIKRDEKLRPLFQKIGVALEEVAKAQNYTLIMQTNDSMVYVDASTDVTRAVITQLGIVIKE